MVTQAETIYEAEEGDFSHLSSEALYQLGSIVLKAYACNCVLYDVIEDEATGQMMALPRRKHLPYCRRSVAPIIEDFSERKLRAIRRVELLSTHEHITWIEEKTASPRKAERKRID